MWHDTEEVTVMWHTVNNHVLTSYRNILSSKKAHITGTLDKGEHGKYSENVNLKSINFLYFGIPIPT